MRYLFLHFLLKIKLNFTYVRETKKNQNYQVFPKHKILNQLILFYLYLSNMQHKIHNSTYNDLSKMKFK